MAGAVVKGLLCVGVPVLSAVVVWQLLSLYQVPHVCTESGESGVVTCRPACVKGQFSLPGMHRCQRWLTCSEIKADIKVTGDLGKGAVKKVYLGRWQDHLVAYNTLLKPPYRDDFRHGLSMLIGLQPSQHVTQLLGYCQNTFITEYHPLGIAENFARLLDSDTYRHLDTPVFRLSMCVKYAEVIAMLHQSPIGVRVMCDSNTLEKTLSQFLITDAFDLVANDLDALPKVTPEAKVKCGRRQLHGDFVAPQQLWPDPDRPFDDELMPGYDEKTDIWKMPDVCQYFLGEAPASQALLFHLFKIHKQCKDHEPSLRPNATEVLLAYNAVLTSLES